MTESANKFKFIDRDRKALLVLIPGWGADYRIFDYLELDFNYLLTEVFSPFTFGGDLTICLKERQLDKVTLLGWSMGGFAAFEFAASYPQLVEELILVSIRRKYPLEEIELVRNSLMKNKDGYLLKFYSQCFYQNEERQRFRNVYRRVYCQEFTLDYLMEGLDYLQSAEIISPKINRVKKISIIHGEFDKIAPIAEAKEIAEQLQQATFVQVSKSGHLPLLSKNFNQLLR